MSPLPPDTDTAELRLTGTVAAKGLVRGRLVIGTGVSRAEAPAMAATAEREDPTAARTRLAGAVAEAARQLAGLAERSDETAAEMLGFQIALLEDPALIEPAEPHLAAGVPADAAWRTALDDQIADYRAAEDAYFQARASDLEDLRDRVSALLTGHGGPAGSASCPPEIADAILVLRDLPPSRFLEMDWARIRGVALTEGSAASHVAMLARARGLPLLVGLDTHIREVAGGTPAVLDAEAGTLIVAPTAKTAAAIDQRLLERKKRAAADAAYLHQAAATRDGSRVTVLLNADDPAMLSGLDPATTDGIGLARSELHFYRLAEAGKGLPDEEAQLADYRRLIDWAAGRPVTIRTLDAGGDKPIPGLTPDGERNPFLGLRGLRLSLARPEIFVVQVRALLRAAAHGPVKVMLPMVTVPEELDQARELFEAALTDLQRAGRPASIPALGMMVEVPAAALTVERFDADFFSIGTNDLIQYVTAAGRDEPAVAHLYQPDHPAVLALIRRVAAHGRSSGKEVSVCGDMAGAPETLRLLLDCGIRTVSVPPAALAATKATIAGYG